MGEKAVGMEGMAEVMEGEVMEVEREVMVGKVVGTGVRVVRVEGMLEEEEVGESQEP